MHTPPIREFVEWTSAHFHTEEARDRFLRDVATREAPEIEVEPMPHNSKGARVRWRPGHFLGLNDVAYACGGRIVVDALQRRGA